MANSRLVEVSVGIFIVLGIIAMVALTFKVSNFGSFYSDNSYSVKASFENISGLKERSAVTIAGVTIGRVSKIDVDPETFEAAVEMEIDSKYQEIPLDSSAGIYTAGLLGEKYIGIDPGGAPEFLEQGSEINLTQSSLVLEKLISQFLFSQSEE